MKKSTRYKTSGEFILTIKQVFDPGVISKHGKGGNEPVVNDTFMGFADVSFGIDFYDPPQSLCIKASQTPTQLEPPLQ